jgi:hypothetical protein
MLFVAAKRSDDFHNVGLGGALLRQIQDLRKGFFRKFLAFAVRGHFSHLSPRGFLGDAAFPCPVLASNPPASRLVQLILAGYDFLVAEF